MEEAFSKIYRDGVWNGGKRDIKWCSGPNKLNFDWYSSTVNEVLASYNIETVCVIGCGDWTLDSTIDWPSKVRSYIGIDVVPGLISDLDEKYSNDVVSFKAIDVTKEEIPVSDLYIAKDVLQHWKNSDIYRFMNKVKLRSKYILIINCCTTAVDFGNLQNIGGFRHLSLTKYPLKYYNPKLLSRFTTKEASLVDFTTIQSEMPTILIGLPIKDKAYCLEPFLKTLYNLDYPKNKIKLWIRINDCNDRSQEMVEEWLEHNEEDYLSVIKDFTNVDPKLKEYGEHEWNPHRFEILGSIRQNAMNATLTEECDFFFTIDTDIFLTSDSLKALVELNLGIASPMLRQHNSHKIPYSNYHSKATPLGYLDPKDRNRYTSIFNRTHRGIHIVDVVHICYLIRADVIPLLRYRDSTDRHEYVIFSHSARLNGIDQYLDNRKEYGFISRGPSDIDIISNLMPEIDPNYV